jgi:threonine/homoserine/homoserine lactone efflux protein
MTNVLGVVAGVVLGVVGVVLLVLWWEMFVKALMAVVPVLLLLIGAGVVVYFVSEIKSAKEMEKEKASGDSKKEGS